LVAVAVVVKLQLLQAVACQLLEDLVQEDSLMVMLAVLVHHLAAVVVAVLVVEVIKTKIQHRLVAQVVLVKQVELFFI